MGFKDVMAFLSPYLAVFLCVFIIIVCFLINYTTPSSIEFEHRFPQQMNEQGQQMNEQGQQMNEQGQQMNEQIQERRFRAANINRLELAESMTNYAIYLREKMERERIKEDIVIFINPGDENPVLGQLIVD
jgi:predicted PurR-regulated permease PerM